MLATPRWSKGDIDKIRAQRIAHEKDLVERKQQANRTYSQAYAKNVDYDISELKQQRDIAKEQEKNRPQMARLNWEKAPYEGYSGEALRNALIKDAQARDPGFARLGWEKSDEHRQRALEAIGKQNEPQMARLGWEKSDDFYGRELGKITTQNKPYQDSVDYNKSMLKYVRDLRMQDRRNAPQIARLDWEKSDEYGQRIMDQIDAQNKPAQDRIDYDKSMLSHVRDLRLQDRQNAPAMAEFNYYKQLVENQEEARANQLAALMGRGAPSPQGQNRQTAPAGSSYTPPTTQFKSGGFFSPMSGKSAKKHMGDFLRERMPW